MSTRFNSLKMLQLLQLNIENLASIKSATYNFKSCLDVIVGMNKDTAPIELKDFSLEQLLELMNINIPSNGSGKSMIIEALNLCLFGLPIRPGIITRKLIRKKEDSCTIELICKNDWLNLSKIRIVRTFFTNKNKTSILKIYETKEGEDEIEIPKNADNLDTFLLEKYIGLSKDDLINFFLIQKDRYTPFLLLSDTKKKEILSKFTGIKKYSFVEDKIISKIEEINKKSLQSQNEISKIEGKIEIYNKQIEDFPDEEKFTDSLKEELNNYNSKIKKCEQIISEKQKEINEEKELKDIINEYFLIHWKNRKSKLENLVKDNKYEKEKNTLKKEKLEKENSIKEIEDALEEANSLLLSENSKFNQIDTTCSKLKALLSNLITCPNCKFKFDPKGNKSEEEIKKDFIFKEKEKSIKEKLLKEINGDIKELKNLIISINNEIKIIKIKIEKTDNCLSKIKNIKTFILDMISSFEEDLKGIERNLKSLDTDISLEQDKIKNIKNKIEEHKSLSYENILQSKEKIKKEISKLEINKKSYEEQIKKNDLEIQLNKDTNVAYNNFKNYLYNKMIFNIECIVNDYLQRFSDLSVEIKSSKLLADGKTQRDEINCSVLRNKEEISYFLLSSGEKAVIDIAFILTFQHILNTTSNNGLNFLSLDEITGIDAFNQNKILVPLNVVKKPIIFISHVSINSDFNTTYVIKENNESNIIQK